MRDAQRVSVAGPKSAHHSEASAGREELEGNKWVMGGLVWCTRRQKALSPKETVSGKAGV